jgi:hypothetical protein
MKNLNIFIGSTARRWSEKIDGNRLLLGNRLDKEQHNTVLVPNHFPTSETKEYSRYNEYLKQASIDYPLYLNSQKIENQNYFNEIAFFVENYKDITVIVASGGLFGNTFTPLVLNLLLEKKKNIRLIIQQTDIHFLKDREQRLINYVEQHYKISIHLVQIKNIHHKHGNQKLDVVLNDFDKLAISQINH